MPSDQLVTVPGSGTAPLAYLIAAGQEMTVKALFATFDGSAALSAFLPCVRILSPSGQVVGEYVTDDQVAVAGSADVSFFPKGKRGAAAAAAPIFHDVNDDITLQDRWALNTFQIRGGQLDTDHSDAWTGITSTTITSALTVNQTNELVYAFTIKSFIRSLTSNAPFTDIVNGQQVPNLVSGATINVARAGGQGSGVVNYSAVVPAGDVGSQTYETIMVGFKPTGGGASQVTQRTTFVDSNPYAAAPYPPTTLPGDIVLVQVAVRNGNASPSIATPAGWSLIGKSPDRSIDPLFGVLDQFVYLKVI